MRTKLQLGLNLCLGSRRGGVNPGNLPATFTVGSNTSNIGTKRISRLPLLLLAMLLL